MPEPDDEFGRWAQASSKILVQGKGLVHEAGGLVLGPFGKGQEGFSEDALPQPEGFAPPPDGGSTICDAGGPGSAVCSVGGCEAAPTTCSTTCNSPKYACCYCNGVTRKANGTCLLLGS